MKHSHHIRLATILPLAFIFTLRGVNTRSKCARKWPGKYPHMVELNYDKIQYGHRLFHEPNIFAYRNEPYSWKIECFLAK